MKIFNKHYGEHGWKNQLSYWWMFDRPEWMKPFKWARIYGEHFARACKWFVRGWSSYEWDYWHLLEVVYLKLGDMADCIEEYGNHEGVEETVAEIKQAREMVKKLMDDPFLDEAEAQSGILEKYGKLVSKYGEPNERGTVQVWTYRERETAENHDDCTAMEREMWNLEEHLRNEHAKKTFAFIAENYKKWWD